MDFMLDAIKIAEKSENDLPIGAVIVKDGKIIASACNQKEKNNDVTAHAEIIAIKEAQKKLENYILDDCEIYVTLEPCPMCSWAILNARFSKVYFGAYNNLYGALGTVLDLRKFLNSKTVVIGGILEEQCAALLKEYFSRIR